MADVTKEDVIEFIANMSVLELSELVKELEEKFGVSAAAPVAMMAAGPGEAGGGEAARGADRIRRHSHGCRRQENPGYQRSSRHHRLGVERRQGLGRRGPQTREGGHCQGRRRKDQGAARRSRRAGRNEVRPFIQVLGGASVPLAHIGAVRKEFSRRAAQRKPGKSQNPAKAGQIFKLEKP